MLYASGELKTETQIRYDCEQYEVDNIGIFPNPSIVSILLQINLQKVASFLLIISYFLGLVYFLLKSHDKGRGAIAYRGAVKYNHGGGKNKQTQNALPPLAR